MIKNNNMNLLARLPYGPAFLFVDFLEEINEEGASGSFYLDPDLDFYKGHFKDHPVTPGVILTEIMAQIGLVCLGVFLLGRDMPVHPFALTSSEITFLKPVYPAERVRVKSQKIYFRFGKLKCKVSLLNEKSEVACAGVLSGILIKEKEL